MTHFTCPSSNCYYTITTILGLHQFVHNFLQVAVGHGSIDGYSRLIVYLHCSDNNRADTILQLFVEAARHYGCPSRVRGDRGGENTSVADFMISECGPSRGSYIAGRSVHNQRIKGLWRDMFTVTLCSFIISSITGKTLE